MLEEYLIKISNLTKEGMKTKTLEGHCHTFFIQVGREDGTQALSDSVNHPPDIIYWHP